MGQNMVGWLRIDTSDFADSDFTLKFFEVLDPDGNFYNANLRAAKQELVYRSDGNARVWEPEFTFYGFRYVLVEGLEKVEADWFTGCVAYSDMEQTGEIKTSKELVNRLFLNALWSQKGNFVDVPTDCPQRDERLGWTGDAQIFCGAANFNMDVTAFFAKYMYDVYQEQQKSGCVVPFFVPSFGNNGDFSSAVWGDAATIIPWTCYLHSGDTYVLERQYPGMKAWVEYIRKQDRGSRLWNTGFHLGDWLALDNIKTEMRTGLTPTDMVASAYYLYSVTLLAKAAKVLRKHEEQQEYEHLADEIKQAMQNEYVTPTGRIASDTQTANVIALYMGFAIDQSRAAAMLHEKLMNNDGHLNTGFVGTAYLCRVLSDHGYNDTAYRLFLNRDYPGWLYAVERGATTIWERWNSILPDGSLGDAEMNSFNHYSYGAIMEWVYRNVGGLQPMDDGAGFRRVRLAPQPNNRLEWISVTYDSACGTYRSEWRIEKEQLRFIFEIPFGATALLTLPDAPVSITLNGQARAYSDGMKLRCGRYEISYRPTIEYYTEFGLCSNAKEVFQNPKLMAILNEYIPAFSQIPQHAFVFPFEGDVLSFLTQVGIVLTSDVQRDITDKMASIRTWDI
jgi:alpha-L-rhamnosidase